MREINQRLHMVNKLQNWTCLHIERGLTIEEFFELEEDFKQVDKYIRTVTSMDRWGGLQEMKVDIDWFLSIFNLFYFLNQVDEAEGDEVKERIDRNMVLVTLSVSALIKILEKMLEIENTKTGA